MRRTLAWERSSVVGAKNVSHGTGLVATAIVLTSLVGLSHSPDASATVTFRVNSTASTPDAVPGDGICDDGTGHCTIAAAALETQSVGMSRSRSRRKPRSTAVSPCGMSNQQLSLASRLCSAYGLSMFRREE